MHAKAWKKSATMQKSALDRLRTVDLAGLNARQRTSAIKAAIHLKMILASCQPEVLTELKVRVAANGGQPISPDEALLIIRGWLLAPWRCISSELITRLFDSPSGAC